MLLELNFHVLRKFCSNGEDRRTLDITDFVCNLEFCLLVVTHNSAVDLQIYMYVYFTYR